MRWNVPHSEWRCAYWVQIATRDPVIDLTATDDDEVPRWDVVLREFNVVNKLRNQLTHELDLT